MMFISVDFDLGALFMSLKRFETTYNIDVIVEVSGHISSRQLLGMRLGLDLGLERRFLHIEVILLINVF